MAICKPMLQIAQLQTVTLLDSSSADQQVLPPCTARLLPCGLGCFLSCNCPPLLIAVLLQAAKLQNAQVMAATPEQMLAHLRTSPALAGKPAHCCGCKPRAGLGCHTFHSF